MRVQLAVSAAVLAVWVCSAAKVQAQAPAPNTGTVRGRVTIASSGDPAHGATVMLVNGNRTATTDSDGRFEIPSVPPGEYEVLALRQYFDGVRATAVVRAGETASVDLALTLAAVHESVTVTATAGGARTTFDAFNAVTSLDSTQLARKRGPTLADALADQPGMAVRSFGAGSARPIIRGFDGDRVLVMQDGVRTGDLSSQSGDHGVTIDPAGLDRLEVVKGPATLLYGSNAIGGVVNAVTPQDAFRTSPFAGMVGSVSIDTGSANAQAGVNAQVQHGTGRWLVWAGGGSRRTGDYDTPDGTVGNSATLLSDGRLGLGWLGSRSFVSIGGTFESGRYGIPFAADFHRHEEEEGGSAGEGEGEDLRVDIQPDRYDVRLDAGLRNVQSSFVDMVKLTVGYTDYGHREIEVDGGLEQTGTTFSNRTTTLRAEAEQKRQGRLGGRLGFEWFGRDFQATGEEALAPATSQSAFSVFAYEELAFDRFRLQFGGRVERNAYDPGERPEGGHEHDDSEDGEAHEPPEPRNREFVGASGSFGLYAGLGEHGAFVANLTGASRAPALEELYNFGPHVGNLTFEVGNPDLALEKTLGLEVSLRRRADRAQAELNVFAYRIANFVFLEYTGAEVDGLREAEYVQGDSRFLGFEASGSVELGREMHLHAGLSYVSARLTDLDQALPRIPPLSGRIELEVPWRALTFSPEVVFRSAQDSVSPGETPTDGSVALNVGLTYLMIKGHTTHAVTIEGYNLTNERYRLHTSFIKDLAPEMGIGIRATYTVRFF